MQQIITPTQFSNASMQNYVYLRINEIWAQQSETESLISSKSLEDYWKGKTVIKCIIYWVLLNHLQPFPMTPVIHSNIYSTLTPNKWKNGHCSY